MLGKEFVGSLHNHIFGLFGTYCKSIISIEEGITFLLLFTNDYIFFSKPI